MVTFILSTHYGKVIITYKIYTPRCCALFRGTDAATNGSSWPSSNGVHHTNGPMPFVACLTARAASDPVPLCAYLMSRVTGSRTQEAHEAPERAQALAAGQDGGNLGPQGTTAARVQCRLFLVSIMSLQTRSSLMQGLEMERGQLPKGCYSCVCRLLGICTPGFIERSRNYCVQSYKWETTTDSLVG